MLINQRGRILAWDCATASARDGTFHPPIARFAAQTVVLVDSGFHRTAGDPANMKVYARFG